MATSSILKEFYVRDAAAFERLRQELDRHSSSSNTSKPAADSDVLKRGREKLATFMFKSDVSDD